MLTICRQYYIALWGFTHPCSSLVLEILRYNLSIYQSYWYLFSHTLIGSHNLRYPRLLVYFEAEVKLTGCTDAKNTCLKIKCIFIPLFWWILKQLSPSGLVHSGWYSLYALMLWVLVHICCGLILILVQIFSSQIIFSKLFIFFKLVFFFFLKPVFF